MSNDYNIVHNTEQSRFEVEIDGSLAVLLYVLRPGKIIYTSTRVPRHLEGGGVGSDLAKTALEYAREKDLTVVPNCSFVRAYIQRHPEYKDLTVAAF
jgi:predicted GNAT family acetyltransferase